MLELVEPHAGSVYLRVLIIDLHTRHAVLTADMRWVRTSHRLAVVWPRGARVGAGTYRVTVSAHDRHNGNILRHARISGQTTLTVKAPAPPVTSAPEAGVPTPAQTVADGAVFPVRGAHSFGDSENRFGAPRSGPHPPGSGRPDRRRDAGRRAAGRHDRDDQPIRLAAPATTSSSTRLSASTSCSPTARRTRSPSPKGRPSPPGQPLCQAGQTGDATAPHLHFEMWVGGWQAKSGHPIDPLPYLEAWEKAG